MAGPPTAGMDLSDSSAILQGDESNQYYGWDVAVLLDCTGDGVAELLVGQGISSAVGGAWIFYGPIAGELGSEDADLSVEGESGDRGGWCVADAGDVDSTGLVDLITAAWGTDGSDDGAGTAWVIPGAGI